MSNRRGPARRAVELTELALFWLLLDVLFVLVVLLDTFASSWRSFRYGERPRRIVRTILRKPPLD